jgi:beta-glucosidase/6-phospho-beta-glucosidase/beta-galactosidase
MLAGAGISANQAESPNGRRAHRWDDLTRLHRLDSNHNLNFGNGVGFDQYYAQDLNILKQDLQLNTFRTSLSAQRLLDENGHFRQEGIDHYKRLIDCAMNQQLNLLLTVNHFDDLRTGLHWHDEEMVKIFADYADRVLREFADCVRLWTPINEPKVNAFLPYQEGALDIWPNPMRIVRAIENEALAHKIFFNLAQEYQDAENPLMVIPVDNVAYIEPLSPHFVNKAVAEVLDYLDTHFFLRQIAGYFDMIGLNYYWHRKVGVIGSQEEVAGSLSDTGALLSPEHLTDVLVQLHQYRAPILITEVGLADREDKYREWYYAEIVSAVKRAMDQGVDVAGIIAWALIDNFEMPPVGYDAQYGLIKVDRQNLARHLRPSAGKVAESLRSLIAGSPSSIES